jgi:uncharacterized phage protein gp47/JayE
MAIVPIPRSYSQIVSDMVDAFTSRKGIANLRIGSPILSIIEAAAQSDVRSSQDLFSFLNSISLDRAEGDALDRIGADEDLPRRTESFGSTLVDITDTSFTKKSTKIYVGKAAPIIGSGTIYVADASAFTANGNVYIGRGTVSSEGPLVYTAKTNLGTYWSLTLQAGSETQRFHNYNETVVLAQGGNRTVPAGSVVQTAQGNVTTAISFSTLYAATLPDGETIVTGVQSVAQRPGLDGNVPSSAIVSFASPPFTGATVTNPLPVSNALAGEDDRSYRERIRRSRQSKSKGTALAIETNVLGVSSIEESKTVLSASVVSRQGYPTTLYIDDGTGYEERNQGVAIESIVGSASGGEKYFRLINRPVTKAFIETSLQEPFALSGDSKLAIMVGGVEYKHSFSASKFRDISAASAYEVAASVNGDPSCTFGARLSNSGTGVSFFATADSQEELEATDAAVGEVDAKAALGIGVGQVNTLLLYKNDRLLSKDGRLASLTSATKGTWPASLTNPATLAIDVDGTGGVTGTTYTITNQDFIDGQTGFNSVSSANSIDSWVTVLNNKITGITATKSGSNIVITSNRGRSSSAGVRIVSGTLVPGVFSVASSFGVDSDYTFNRNTSELCLNVPLTQLDTLSSGTTHTRAFVESAGILPMSVVGVDAQLWFAVDGAAEIISTSISTGSVVQVSDWGGALPAWGNRVAITGSVGGSFANVHVGDWAIFNDSGFNAANRGTFRVSYVQGAGNYFEIERPNAVFAAEFATLVTGGLVIVRSNTRLQVVTIPVAANYTAASLADLITAGLVGATAEVYKTNAIRVRTDSYKTTGDIALVAQSAQAVDMKFSPGGYNQNLTSHLGTVESANPETGTPSFVRSSIDTVTSTTQFARLAVTGGNSSSFVVFKNSMPDDATHSRVSNLNFYSEIKSISGTTIVTRTAPTKEFLSGDSFYTAAPFAIGPEDEFGVLVDEDEQTKRYVLPMWRKLKPTTASYGATNYFYDVDNSNALLTSAFGGSFDFTDFAVWMKARAKSHSEGSVDTNKTILWRYFRYGSEGNDNTVRYSYPTLPSTTLTVTSTPASTISNVSVALPSGAARTGVVTSSATKVGVLALGGNSATYILGYSITTATRVIKLDYDTQTVNFTVGETVTGAGGAFGVVASDSDAGTTGTLTLTGVVGTFISGEVLTGSVSGVAKASGSQYGVTTATLDIVTPGALSVHGFDVGNILYVHSTDVNFQSGLRTVTAKSANTITFRDVTNTAQPATPNIGNVSYDVAEATLTGSTVVVNDICSVLTGSSLPALYETAGRVTAKGAQYWTVVVENTLGITNVPTWCSLEQTSNLNFFPIDTAGSTILAIAASVNVLAAAANSNCPVTAVAIGTGADTSGSVTLASYDEFSTVGYCYPFTDGINWVKDQAIIASNYRFTFKDAILVTSPTNCDWGMEEVRLVPVTAKNTINWMNSQSVSGLSSSAVVGYSSEGSKLQISTLTSGSQGGVHVQGGTANFTSAPVVGSASSIASVSALATVSVADSVGIRGGMWVEIQNSEKMPKSIFTSATTVQSVSVAGLVELGVTNAWTAAGVGTVNGYSWQFEKQGKYTAVAWDGIGANPNLASIVEGDWVIISGAANSLNHGQFRIVSISASQDVFWIENSASVEERALADLSFYQYNSIMPGDTFVVNSAILGAGNVGVWMVISPMNASNKKFSVSVSSGATSLFSGPVTLGTNYSLFQIYEGSASKLVKRVVSIAPNLDGRYLDLLFNSDYGYRQVSAAAGSVIQPLDKLGFSTSLFQGTDGYRYQTGLLQEVNRVAYGDESDPAAYPGVIAAGAKVNIQGPLVKRITCAFALRLKSGVTSADVIDRAKSAVASVINKASVGESIAIVELAAAAQSVNGVMAVTVLSPTYSSGNDLISVQPFEKPMVIDISKDIQISLVSD